MNKIVECNYEGDFPGLEFRDIEIKFEEKFEVDDVVSYDKLYGEYLIVKSIIGDTAICSYINNDPDRWFPKDKLAVGTEYSLRSVKV